MPIKSFVINKVKTFRRDFKVYNNIYLSRSALLDNFDLIKKYSPSQMIIPVLKSNAYGHGLEQVSEILKDRDFPYIAVDGYFEALQIREISSQPVLIMGAINPENYQKIHPKNFTFVVHDLETVTAIARSRRKFVIHIEIDTGMSRHGVKPNELSNFVDAIKFHKNINIEGILSHLADADNPNDDDFNKKQTKKFDEAVKILLNKGIKPKYIHLAQSAGCIKIKSRFANTIRVGLALYGISPISTQDKNSYKYSKLKPILSLNSTISKINQLVKGDSVGYNRTYKSKKNTRIGVLPLGYYEGLPRLLSNKGIVKKDKTYLKIIGKICMNHIFIELTDEKVSIGDEINIISDNPKDKNSIKNLCNTYGLFSYELLTGLSHNIRRTIID